MAISVERIDPSSFEKVNASGARCYRLFKAVAQFAADERFAAFTTGNVSWSLRPESCDGGVASSVFVVAHVLHSVFLGVVPLLVELILH